MLERSEYIYSIPDGLTGEKNQDNIVPFINYKEAAPKRCLEMLLKKHRGEHFQSEVIMVSPEKPKIPNLHKKLNEAKILLMTDGGLVPKGNPEELPSTNAKICLAYSIQGCEALKPDKYEVSHQGYDNQYVNADPNRLLPVDIMRELEKEGIIGKLCDIFLTTAGVMTLTEESIRLGKRIASSIRQYEVDAVIITSACGTSTRCGTYIGKEIENIGIPVVQVTNLTRIAIDSGSVRIVKGNNVCYPFGNPQLPLEQEKEQRRRLVMETLNQLQQVIE